MTTKYNFITSTGTIVADTESVLADVKAEWVNALGVGLDTDASTPQGTLIQTETLARTSVMKNNAELASLLNPNYSYGKYLDAIAALLGIQREANLQTVVKNMVLEAVNGTVVPAGTQIETADGDRFVQLETVTINTGSVRVTYYSSEFGNIPIQLGIEYKVADGYNVIGLNRVYSDPSTTVNPGTKALSDGALKARRLQQLHRQGIGSLGAIKARALSVPGVTSVFAVENATGAPGSVNGITFSTPNGVWICVAGIFDKQQLADALWLAHMGGQPWDYGADGQGVKVDSPNGIGVVDPSSNQTYAVKFTTPVMYDLYVNIVVRQSAGIASPDDIRQAILDYAAGNLNGELGFVIGASQSSFEIAGAVSSVYPGLYVKDCRIAAVPKGSPAPNYPADFSNEWVSEVFQQADIVRGFINVQIS